MGVYKNGYRVMLEPLADTFEDYLILLKRFILENTPWTFDEENSTETELYFDTGYEILYCYPYSGYSDRMRVKVTSKYGPTTKSGSSYIYITTTVNDITYSSCTLYALIKEGLTIWHIHTTLNSSLLTKCNPNNIMFEEVQTSSGVGAYQIEFEDIINNRIAQVRRLIYDSTSIFTNSTLIAASYELEDGTWNNCYIQLFNNRYNKSSVLDDRTTAASNDKIYCFRHYVCSYSSPKKIIGFIPQLCSIIRPSYSIPRSYYPFKNNGYKYQYISYPICYIEKESE